MRFVGLLLGTVGFSVLSRLSLFRLGNRVWNHGLWRDADDAGCTVWYFFSDVYPSLHNGQRPLDPPQFWRNLWERQPQDTGAQPVDNDIAAAAAPEVR